MKPLHVCLLVIAAAIAGGVAVKLTENVVTPVPVATVPPPPPVPVPEMQPAPRRLTRVSTHKPAVQSSGASGVKPNRRPGFGIPAIPQPSDTFAIPAGDGGIFSGADPKDTRIYHFVD